MARLLTSRAVPIAKLTYDVTVDDTHNFFVTQRTSKQAVLAHNCHALSKEGLDALLKPLEENVSPTSQDKRMVCIFCTTEPEKMRATILSRCAPAFVIEVNNPSQIADRLEYVCNQEGFEYSRDALEVIAERTECHIRDCLKAVEGVSMLGSVNMENVSKYLHLDLNKGYLKLLEALAQPTFAEASTALRELQKKASPVTCYERVTELALLCYKYWQQIEVNIPAYYDKAQMRLIGDSLQDRLLHIAERLSARPGKPTFSALECDLLALQKSPTGNLQSATQIVYVQSPVPQVPPVAAAPGYTASVPTELPQDTQTQESVVNKPIVIPVTSDTNPIPPKPHAVGTVKVVKGVAVNPIGQKQVPKNEVTKVDNGYAISPEMFGTLLSKALDELLDGGQKGRTNMGKP